MVGATLPERWICQPLSRGAAPQPGRDDGLSGAESPDEEGGEFGSDQGPIGAEVVVLGRVAALGDTGRHQQVDRVRPLGGFVVGEVVDVGGVGVPLGVRSANDLISIFESRLA
jgi:hypothetical protein